MTLIFSLGPRLKPEWRQAPQNFQHNLTRQFSLLIIFSFFRFFDAEEQSRPDFNTGRPQIQHEQHFSSHQALGNNLAALPMFTSAAESNHPVCVHIR